jgi:hypothetical protein
MVEILPGVFDWVGHNAYIEKDVHSTYIAGEGACVIDPMEPDVDPNWFEDRGRPQHVFLTNRLHDRACAWWVEHFDCKVWVHETGLHEQEMIDLNAVGFAFGDSLPGGVEALSVGALCPEETALLIPRADGVLAIGDGIMRWDEDLDFPADFLMGDDPESVKSGLVESYRKIVSREWDAAVFAHREPIVKGAREAIGAFLDKH